MVGVGAIHPMIPRETSRVAVGALAAAFLALGPGGVIAQTLQRFELEWESPSVCPAKDEVDEQIRSLLRAAPGSALPSHLGAKGVIEPIGERFQLTLSIRIGQTRGARVIQSDECGSLGKAAAVVLGLLIRKEQDLGRELSDSDLGSEFKSSGKPIEPGPDKSQSEPSHPGPSTTTAAPAARPQMLDEPTQRQWYVLVKGPSVAIDFWTLPNRSLGYGLAAGVLHPPWRLFALATLWSSQERTTTDFETYRTTFKRKSFEVWGCRGWRSGAFEAAPCIVTAMDLVSAGASSDRLTNTEQRVAIVSAGAGLSLHWYLTPWLSLYLSTTGRVMANRRTFTVREVSGDYATHSVPSGAWLTSIGGEWIF
jgi:hypothetical protein